jgi:tetratricopeptide (TPR) repeat protein
MESSVAVAGAAPSAALAWTLNGAGALAHFQGDSSLSTSSAERSVNLFRKLDDPLGIGYALVTLGIIAEDRGDYAAAEPLFAEAQVRFDRVGAAADRGLALYHAGVIAYGRGHLDQALDRLEEAVRLGRASGIAVVSIAAPLGYMGLIFTERGELASAADACEEALALTRESGDQEGYVRRLAGLAVLAAACGCLEPAVRLLAAAEALRVCIGLLPHALPESLAYDRVLDIARSHLGKATFDEAWLAGISMSPDECLTDVQTIMRAARQSPA